MEVIRGTTRPRRRRRWWTARPGLRLVRDQQTLQTREDPLFIAMIGSFALFLMAFAMFMGGWTGG